MCWRVMFLKKGEEKAGLKISLISRLHSQPLYSVGLLKAQPDTIINLNDSRSPLTTGLPMKNIANSLNLKIALDLSTIKIAVQIVELL